MPDFIPDDLRENWYDPLFAMLLSAWELTDVIARKMSDMVDVAPFALMVISDQTRHDRTWYKSMVNT